MGSCFDKHAKLLSKLRIGTKKSGLMHSVLLLTNPEWSIVRINTIRLIAFVQYKATVMVLQSIQTCSLSKRYPHGSATAKESSMGRRFEFKKHKTSLFLLICESTRTVFETAYDRLERTL